MSNERIKEILADWSKEYDVIDGRVIRRDGDNPPPITIIDHTNLIQPLGPPRETCSEVSDRVREMFKNIPVYITNA